MILLICFTHLCLSLCQWIKSYKKDIFEKQIYFREYFSGIKDEWIPRAYSSTFLLKRFFLCLIVIVFSFATQMIRISLFCGIQVLSCCFVLIIRPFNTIKINIVEIINEVIFSVLSLLLLYLNKESRWEKYLQYIYIGLIIS
jgi:hypothetical protein